MTRTFCRLAAAACAAVAATSLAAQEPPRRGIDIPAVRKAVVTVHALDPSNSTSASGTGFFVGGGQSSIIVTAAHVITGASACSVELSDGQTMRCSVVASDTGKDVVMLQVPGIAPGTLRWGASSAVEDGDEITVVSNPLGQLPGTISRGIVSAQRVVQGTKLIQITAAISHGSSGAPVLNSNGEVVGVVRSTIERGQALNFATATDAVRNLMLSPEAIDEAQSVLRPGERPVVGAGGGGGPGGPPGDGVRSDGRRVTVGQSVSGRLTTSDSLDSDDTYYQLWSFSPPPGRDVTITLTSDAFDSYLLVRRGGERLARDDDSGPGCGSRITQQFSDAGPYLIMVNTIGRRNTGDYTLAVADGAEPTIGNDCAAGGGGGGGGRGATPGTGEEIRIGQTITGELTARDSVWDDQTFYRLYTLRPAPGTTATIDLESTDFDAFLMVRGGDLDSLLRDDDSGYRCNSRLVQTFNGSGPYYILANTVSRGEVGRYQLSVTRGDRGLLRGDMCGTPESRYRIRVGEQRTGRLTPSDELLRTDSTYMQGWALDGRVGQTVTVDLESDDFDAYMMIRGPGLAQRLRDDDSGGNCSSRLVVTFPESGEYQIIVNTIGQNYATGEFRLSVTAGSRPSSGRACNRR